MWSQLRDLTYRKKLKPNKDKYGCVMQVCSPWSISHAYIFGNDCGFSFADRKFTYTLHGINAAKYSHPIHLYSASNKYERWWVTFDKVAVTTNKDETSMWFDFSNRLKLAFLLYLISPQQVMIICLHPSLCDPGLLLGQTF